MCCIGENPLQRALLPFLQLEMEFQSRMLFQYRMSTVREKAEQTVSEHKPLKGTQLRAEGRERLESTK